MRSKKRKTALAQSNDVKSFVQAASRNRRERMRKLSEIEAHRPALRNDLLPALATEYLAPADLKFAKRRVRKTSEVQLERVKSSIARFGICQPILVDAHGQIVHGHVVWAAANALGVDRVPVIRIEHLTTEEVQLLRIALNRLSETGEWDVDNLRIELAELINLGEDPVITGLEIAEIDVLLLDELDATTQKLDDEPVIQLETAVSRVGDVWCLGKHLLLQGSALDPVSLDRLFDDGVQARIVLTDEPYNVPNVGHVTGQGHHREFAMAAGEMSRNEFAVFNRNWMSVCLTHLIDGGLLATFIDWRSVDLVIEQGKGLDLELLNLVVWNKSNAGQGSLWRSQHELLPVFKKGNAPHINNVQMGKPGRWRSNVWIYPGASSVGSDARSLLGDHPTVKPRAMLEDALLDVTLRGDIVIDPFAGSGSTLVAAEATGRVCRAVEIDGLYCDLIIRRWQAMTGQEATLVVTGKTFQETTQARTANLDPGEGGDV